MYRLPHIVSFLLLMASICAAPAWGALSAPRFPWISPFEDGRYIGEIFPSGIVETDYETVSAAMTGKDIIITILDSGGDSFDTVAIGYYDEKKRDMVPRWTSALREGLPYIIDDLPFEDIVIKYNYLPGDKYVSCNFKVSGGASFGSERANIKAFRVEADMDYAGVSLKAGDFILASDSSGGGSLSNLSNGDYSDLVFVVSRTPASPMPISCAFLAVGGGGLLGLTLWSFRRGQKGLE